MFTSKRIIAGVMALAMLLTSTAVVAAGVANRFDDVPEGRFFTDPVAWAAETGITTGTSATTFHPNRLVKRSEAVTFLHRFYKEYLENPVAGTPGPQGARGPAGEAGQPGESTFVLVTCFAAEQSVEELGECLLSILALSDNKLISLLEEQGFPSADVKSYVGSIDFLPEAVEKARGLRARFPGDSPEVIISKLLPFGFVTKEAEHGANVAFAP